MGRWFSLRKVNVKTKVIICFLLLALIPQLLLLNYLYRANRTSLLDITGENIQQLVASNNILLHEKLAIIRDTTMNIMVDRELYELFRTPTMQQSPDSVIVQQYVRDVLQKYFGSLSGVAQVEIITRDVNYKMKVRTSLAPGFFDSALGQAIQSADGAILWLTPADMAAFQPTGDTMSCARRLNLTRVDALSGFSTRLPAGQDRPIIRVLLSDQEMHDILYRNIASLPGASYYILDTKGGTMLSGGQVMADVFTPELWQQMQAKRVGMLYATLANGQHITLCFDTLPQTGWTSVAVFPQDILAQGMRRSTQQAFVASTVVMVLTVLLATVLVISLINRRTAHLIRGVEALKAGEFSTQIPDEHEDEFSYLVHSFNSMSMTLRQLIDENYAIKLSEQEARVQILTAQLNPHYIYNTLNIINWYAMKGRDPKTSQLIVALSRMLQYTSNNKQEYTRLADDIDWLEKYLMVMSERFAGLFVVRWDVDPACLAYAVPKLFLQPLLENSILHGFHDMTEGGIIDVHIGQERDALVCIVRDNGGGMSAQKAEELLEGRGESVGLYNVQRRMTLLFGDAYGLTIRTREGEGCEIVVRMSLDKVRRVAEQHKR